MKAPRLALAALTLCLLVSGCASHYVGVGEEPYGFFSGVWHGIVWPFALMVNIVSWLVGLLGFSLFESIQLVGRPNTGFWLLSSMQS